jgi:hypothetical protein
MRAGLETGPEKTLTTFDEIRRSLFLTGGARMFLITSPAVGKSLSSALESFPMLLQNGSVAKASYPPVRRIEARLRGRDGSAQRPVFVGLVNANSQGGVFLNSAPIAGYTDTSADDQLDFLASLLYAGHGAHGVFMKTWSAGLAYSNGIRVRPLDARVNYYAERTPLLPQTLQFVIGVLKNAQLDSALAEYAIAGAFDGIRSAEPFENRGEAMAADLADGLTPEVVVRFHRRILELRQRSDFAAELFRRMPQVTARVLPGMGQPAENVPGGMYFVIGPEKQLEAYGDYLKKAEGAEARLFRLYPRDFWME